MIVEGFCRTACILACLPVVGAALFATAPIAVDGRVEAGRVPPLIQGSLSQWEAEFHTPQTVPTEPYGSPVRMVPEWAETREVLLSVELQNTVYNEALTRFFQGYVRALIPHVEVGILYDEREKHLLARFIRLMEDATEDLQGRNRVRFIESRVKSSWLRDFGPLFAQDERGTLVLVDTIYRPLSGEFDAWLQMQSHANQRDRLLDEEGFELFRAHRRAEDVTPIYVERHIRQNLGQAAESIRPPVRVSGGDFVFDGEGRVFLSEDTQMHNGSQKRQLEATLQDYCGIECLILLEALPGNAPKHLDLLMKFTGPRTVLLAESFGRRVRAREHDKVLAVETDRILASNERILKEAIPGLRVIRVPILPLQKEDPRSIRNQVRSRILGRVCEEAGVSYAEFLKMRPGDAEYVDRVSILKDRMSETMGFPVDITRDEHLNALCQRYLYSSYDDISQLMADNATVFRSYVNSLQVNLGTRTLFFVPRFTAQPDEDPLLIAGCEKLVEKAYLEAVPGAEIVWVEADALVEMHGALHCVSMTVPQAAGRG